MYGPSEGTRFDPKASLRMVPANVPSLLPPQLIALPPPVPKPVAMTPTYSGSPAFGTPYRAPHMVLQTSTNSPVSDREPSGSRLPPIPNPDLTGRNTGEQAVIVTLQAVANYPNSPILSGPWNNESLVWPLTCRLPPSPRAVTLPPLWSRQHPWTLRSQLDRVEVPWLVPVKRQDESD